MTGRPKEPEYLYINLIEDHEAIDKALLIHDKPCVFVNIPHATNLVTFADERLAMIHRLSKVYLAAHGSRDVDSAVTSSLKMDSTIYYLKDIVSFFAKLLNDDKYKDPNIVPRFKIVLSVCQGVNFAKNLQKKLKEEHGIYVDIIANHHLIQERFMVLPNAVKTINLYERNISIDPNAEKVPSITA